VQSQVLIGVVHGWKRAPACRCLVVAGTGIKLE
jgi:hypothetical protein